MQKFGKINFFGNLEIAGNIIQIKERIIINPTEQQYFENGYKKVIEEQYPKEKEGFNINKTVIETEEEIIIKYEYEQITEDNTEHFEQDLNILENN